MWSTVSWSSWLSGFSCGFDGGGGTRLVIFRSKCLVAGCSDTMITLTRDLVESEY